MTDHRSGSGSAGGRRATIVDIARAADVSKSTVSLVLKGSPLVKAETRERVERVIERFGYVYNRGAANLRTATSSFVGMVMSDLTNPFFAELAVGIEDALYKLGYTPILANTNDDPERQAQVLRTLREHGVAGIIMSPVAGTDAWTLARQLSPSVPTVLTMRRVIGSPLPYVGQDNREGARKAVAYLIDLGHRRIAYIGGFSEMTTQNERITGYRDAHQAAGIVVDESLILETTPTRDGGREAIERALKLGHPPTAAFAYNDIVAMGATRALTRLGIRPGIDFSVVGFDDIAEAEHNAPPLTTIDADTRALGAQTARSLLGMINGADPGTMSWVGQTTLVVRESSGALAGTATPAARARTQAGH